jgi:uncharacterized membrane protein
MPDPVDPLPPPPVPPPASDPPPVRESEINASSLDLPSNIAAALACIPLIGGIVFYIMEKRDGFVRFYAMQSIVFGGAWLLFSVVWRIVVAILVPIPFIGWIFGIPLWIIWAVAQLAFLAIWIVATVKAFTHVRWEIPYIGPIARKQFGEAVP